MVWVITAAGKGAEPRWAYATVCAHVRVQVHHLSCRCCANKTRNVCIHVHTASPAVQGTSLVLGPLNYLFVHTFNSGKYCLGVFDNGRAGGVA